MSPGKEAYGYTYDKANRLRSVSIPGQGDMTWDAYNWNQPGRVIMPGGTIRETEYDPLMRIKAILAKTGKDDTILDYRYTHDRADNITQKATEHGEYKYTYDDLYQLTGAINPKSDDELFVYDKVGNRLEDAKTKGRWEYNGGNELLRAGPTAFEYDAAGNTIEKAETEKTTRYLYNLENRLEKITNKSGETVAVYYYDPFGRRLYKEVDGQRTYFLYTDEGLSGEYNHKGKAIKTYGYKPGSTWTTDPLFMKIGRQYYYYHNDHLGTSQKLTKENGSVVWLSIADVFGKISVSKKSIIKNDLRFPGQYYDAELGLNYNFHRYYAATTGRYLKADPIGYESGINLFAYAINSPINKIDFLGLDTPPPCPFTKCPCGLCEIFWEKNVSKSLNKVSTDKHKILEYEIKDGILNCVVLAENLTKVLVKVPYVRPPVILVMPQYYVANNELYAKFDCLVEYCPATMDRKDVSCTKRRGTEYKVTLKEWIEYAINSY